MKNRKKLTDDQLDAVSGGTTRYDKVSAEDAAKLDSYVCPICGGKVVQTNTDGIPMVKCWHCRVIWTHFNLIWEKVTEVDDGC